MALLVGEQPDPIELAASVVNKAAEKYDEFLPESLQNIGYAARNLDVPGVASASRDRGLHSLQPVLTPDCRVPTSIGTDGARMSHPSRKLSPSSA
jgi:hypothetical protein